MRLLALVALAGLLLSGCAGKLAASPAANVGSDTALAAAGATMGWNYTTPDPGGAPYVRDYAGTLTAQQAADGGVPFGASAPSFQTCCYFSMLDASDLLAPDQLVSIRVTLSWTNTQADHAGLDAALCVPWHCIDFNRGDDESMQEGPHQDVLALVTSGRQDFLDQGLAYQVGARFTNAVVPDGLPYSIHVELVPVGGGLAPGDAYVVQVAQGANLTARLAAPMAAGDGSVGLMAYGANERPFRWFALSGKDGQEFPLDLPGGTYVLSVLDYDHAFLRLRSDREPASLALRPLKQELGQADLVRVPDAQAHEGTLQYTATPGMVGDFPWFLYDDGASAQNAFGFEPQPLGGANLTFRSSSGLVAGIDTSQLSLRVEGVGGHCLNCNGQGDWHPEHYLDDDGTYDLAWRSEGAAGTFVMFTQRYVR
jgi:hypothetical protein